MTYPASISACCRLSDIEDGVRERMIMSADEDEAASGRVAIHIHQWIKYAERTNNLGKLENFLKWLCKFSIDESFCTHFRSRLDHHEMPPQRTQNLKLGELIQLRGMAGTLDAPGLIWMVSGVIEDEAARMELVTYAPLAILVAG